MLIVHLLFSWLQRAQHFPQLSIFFHYEKNNIYYIYIYVCVLYIMYYQCKARESHLLFEAFFMQRFRFILFVSGDLHEDKQQGAQKVHKSDSVAGTSGSLVNIR